MGGYEQIMKNYIQKENSELKQLAQDIYDQKVFTSAHVRVNKDLPMIFMPIALGAFKDWEKDDMQDIGVIYEFYSEAGPRGVNGYPCFTSFKILDKFDTDKMWDYHAKYHMLKEAFKDDETSPVIPTDLKGTQV